MAVATSQKPRKLTSKQIDAYTLIPGVSMSGFSGGIFKEVKAGQKWPGLKGQGDRFVVQATNDGVVFIQQGTVYYQPAQGWVEDYRTYGPVRGAQGAVGMATVSVFVIDVVMGIASKVSGAAAVVIIGTDVIQFLQKYGSLLPKLLKVFVALAKARAVLLVCAPVLYRKVVHAVLTRAFTDGLPVLLQAFPFLARVAAPNLGKAADISTAKSGRTIGKLIGKMGVNALTGQLSWIGGVFSVLLVVVTQCVKAVATSIKLRVADHRTLATSLISQLRKEKVTIDKRSAECIVQEIAKHGKQIRDVLQDVQAAVKALS